MILDPLNSPCRKLKISPFVGCPNDNLKVFKQRRRRPTEEEYLAMCLMELSRGGNHTATTLTMQGFSTSQPSASNDQQFRHKCVVCSKSFSSYQALGGHKTSHRRINAISATSLIPIDDRSKIGNKSYECSVCHKKFRTGQALGGHKRCHYDGGNINGAVLDGILTSDSSKSNTKGEGFDLNLPALPEFKNFDEEEEEMEAPLRTKKARLFLSLKLDLSHA